MLNVFFHPSVEFKLMSVWIMEWSCDIFVTLYFLVFLFLSVLSFSSCGDCVSSQITICTKLIVKGWNIVQLLDVSLIPCGVLLSKQGVTEMESFIFRLFQFVGNFDSLFSNEMVNFSFYTNSCNELIMKIKNKKIKFCLDFREM